MTSQCVYLQHDNNLPQIIILNEAVHQTAREAKKIARVFGVSLSILRKFENAYSAKCINPYILYVVNDLNFANDEKLFPIEIDFLTCMSQQKRPLTIIEVMNHFYHRPYGKIKQPLANIWESLIVHTKIKPADGTLNHYFLKAIDLNASNTQNIKESD
jgi:hypothetical protein